MAPCRRQRSLLKKLALRGHGPAAESLLLRWEAEGVASSTITLVLQAWCDIVRWATHPLDPQTAYWILGKVVPSPVPLSKAAIRVALRLAWTFPYVDVAEALVAHLHRASEAGLAQRLLDTVGPDRKARARKRAAAVRFETLRPTLLQMLGYLTPRYRNVTLATLDESNSLIPHASTDGARVLMPPVVAMGLARETNEWLAAYLLGHEAAHLETGSFTEDLRNEEGHALLAHLAPRRATYLRESARYRLRGAKTVEERVAEERPRHATSARKPSAILTVLLYFPLEQRNALRRVINVFDDARVDAWLERQYPGLRPARAVYEECVAVHFGDPSLMCEERNLLRAVQDAANGRPVRWFVGGRFASVWQKIERIIRTRRTTTLATAAGAIHTAVLVFEVLSSAVEPFHWGVGLGQTAEFLDEERESNDPVEEVAAILDRLSDSTLIWDANLALTGLRVAETNEQDPPDAHGPWYRTDEYDSLRKRLERDVTRIRERTWQPLPGSKETAQLSLAGSPLLDLAYNRDDFNDAEAYYVAFGSRSDVARLHAYVAGSSAGVVADDRVFSFEEGTAAWGMVSFLIDLSVSMKLVRSRGTTTPIERAIQLTLGWGAALARAGFDVGVFGVHDIGRRSITLEKVIDWGEPFSPSRVASVHTMHFGGARLGAAIRRISQRIPTSAPRSPHLVVVLTDTGSRYINRGLDPLLARYLKTERCHACTDAACPYEPTTPKLTLGFEEQSFSVWYPPSYDWTDVARAFQADPRMIPLAILLDDGYPPEQVRETVQPARVGRLVDADDARLLEAELRSLVALSRRLSA